MKRKFAKNDIDIHPDKEYSWKCACGKNGFVDVGENTKNRYPCAACYAKMQLRKSK